MKHPAVEQKNNDDKMDAGTQQTEDTEVHTPESDKSVCNYPDSWFAIFMVTFGRFPQMVAGFTRLYVIN
jgi:hypothetical protein